jgi:hypothetical protein
VRSSCCLGTISEVSFFFIVPPNPAQNQPDNTHARPDVAAPSASPKKPACRKKPMMSTLPHAGLFIEKCLAVVLLVALNGLSSLLVL